MIFLMFPYRFDVLKLNLILKNIFFYFNAFPNKNIFKNNHTFKYPVDAKFSSLPRSRIYMHDAYAKRTTYMQEKGKEQQA